MKGISLITTIPFPPIASGHSSVPREQDVVIPVTPLQRALNLATKIWLFFITPALSIVFIARIISIKSKPFYHPGSQQRIWPEPWMKRPPASVILAVIPRRRFFTPLRPQNSPCTAHPGRF
jgi:hypothetical protein